MHQPILSIMLLIIFSFRGAILSDIVSNLWLCWLFLFFHQLVGHFWFTDFWMLWLAEVTPLSDLAWSGPALRASLWQCRTYSTVAPFFLCQKDHINKWSWQVFFQKNLLVIDDHLVACFSLQVHFYMLMALKTQRRFCGVCFLFKEVWRMRTGRRISGPSTISLTGLCTICWSWLDSCRMRFSVHSTSVDLLRWAASGHFFQLKRWLLSLQLHRNKKYHCCFHATLSSHGTYAKERQVLLKMSDTAQLLSGQKCCSMTSKVQKKSSIQLARF